MGRKSAGRRPDDALDDGAEVGGDVLLRHAEDAPTEGREDTIPVRIQTLTPHVSCTIDLDDETALGAREVNDAISDDELATEGMVHREHVVRASCSKTRRSSFALSRSPRPEQQVHDLTTLRAALFMTTKRDEHNS